MLSVISTVVAPVTISTSSVPRLTLSSTDLKQVESKAKELEARIRSAEPEKGNPTVSPHYYRWRGQLMALEAVLELARGKPRDLVAL